MAVVSDQGPRDVVTLKDVVTSCARSMSGELAECKGSDDKVDLLTGRILETLSKSFVGGAREYVCGRSYLFHQLKNTKSECYLALLEALGDTSAIEQLTKRLANSYLLAPPEQYCHSEEVQKLSIAWRRGQPLPEDLSVDILKEIIISCVPAKDVFLMQEAARQLTQRATRGEIPFSEVTQFMQEQEKQLNSTLRIISHFQGACPSGEEKKPSEDPVRKLFLTFSTNGTLPADIPIDQLYELTRLAAFTQNEPLLKACESQFEAISLDSLTYTDLQDLFQSLSEDSFPLFDNLVHQLQARLLKGFIIEGEPLLAETISCMSSLDLRDYSTVITQGQLNMLCVYADRLHTLHLPQAAQILPAVLKTEALQTLSMPHALALKYLPAMAGNLNALKTFAIYPVEGGEAETKLDPDTLYKLCRSSTELSSLTLPSLDQDDIEMIAKETPYLESLSSRGATFTHIPIHLSAQLLSIDLQEASALEELHLPLAQSISVHAPMLVALEAPNAKTLTLKGTQVTRIELLEAEKVFLENNARLIDLSIPSALTLYLAGSPEPLTVRAHIVRAAKIMRCPNLHELRAPELTHLSCIETFSEDKEPIDLSATCPKISHYLSYMNGSAPLPILCRGSMISFSVDTLRRETLDHLLRLFPSLTELTVEHLERVLQIPRDLSSQLTVIRVEAAPDLQRVDMPAATRVYFGAVPLLKHASFISAHAPFLRIMPMLETLNMRSIDQETLDHISEMAPRMNILTVAEDYSHLVMPDLLGNRLYDVGEPPGCTIA